MSEQKITETPSGEKPVDVCFFYRDLSAGGVERTFVELANNFVARGLRVQFLLESRNGAFESELDPRIDIIAMGTKGRIRRLLGLINYIRRVAPRNITTAVVNFNIVALAARLLTGKRTTLTIAEVIDPLSEFFGGGSWKYKLNYLLVPIFYRFADRIVTKSEGVADSIACVALIARDRITVINNPVFKPEIIDKSQAPLAHPWIGKGRHSVVISAGRLVPQKDQATLLKAFALVSRQRPDARLIILGEGPEKAALLKLRDELSLEGIVDFVGVDSNPFRWFSRATVFALSSRWEGFGNVIVEAMACGCTPVSTDCRSGPSEILSHGRFGHLVPVADPAALANGILAALKQPESQARMITRAAEFSVARAATQYMEIFDLQDF